jgi:hypothetical protein
MKNITFFSLLFILLSLQFSTAQIAKIKPNENIEPDQQLSIIKSSQQMAILATAIDHSIPGDKWAVSVRPTFSRTHGSEALRQFKTNKMQQKLDSYKTPSGPESSERAVVPVLGTNFEANWSVDGVPPDNTIAISNGGFIVTANNDGIEYYTESGNFLYFDAWFDFFNDNSLVSSIYDPKVIYDSGSDRFVMVVLHGSNENTSKVLVCFSQSNDPQDGWWVYTLTGNPLNDGSWFDFPSLGVSTNEIYVTGNLFKGNSFNQSIIYQIPKASGFEGSNLPWQFWSGLSADPFKAFSLTVASHGHQGNYGPGVYLVSNESLGHNKIRLWDLTDDMDGTPELLSYTVNSNEYEPAADALQKGINDELDNGDCRIQSAFYLNGLIHFTYHMDIGAGWNGINYNRLKITNTTNTNSTFGFQGSFDYSYPSVASFSTSVNDPSVMISFLRSSEEIFPEVRVVNCDQDFTWSPSVLVKAGETFVDFLGSNSERWGDYTGIARRHNSPTGNIWLAGCYGANINSQNTPNTFKTWISQISGGEMVSSEESGQEKDINVYPNPTYNLIRIDFTAEQGELTTIALYDMNGRMVKTLYQDVPKPGVNQFSFNQGVLSAGTYLITITTSSKILKNEKLVILD